MKYLSAPWRWTFITGKEKRSGCLFCTAPQLPDDESLICRRGDDFYIILNKYPYSSGHLMIVPFAHLSTPEELDAEKSAEMWRMLQQSMRVLKEALHPEGFNVGMNIGKAAGAGVKDHFHIHVVPRWQGDANFMPITGNTHVASYDIAAVFDILRGQFSRVS